MRSFWIIFVFVCLLFAVQAYAAPVMAVGIAGDELPSLVANTNTATGVLGIGPTGNNGSNSTFTTTIPGGTSVAGVPTSNQVPAPVNPVGTTQNLQGGTAATTLNAPGVTTGVVGSGIPTAGVGSVSTAVTPFNTTSTATASNQGLTALAPGAGTVAAPGVNTGLNTGIPAASGGGSLTTAPALPASTITPPTQAGVTGTGSAGSAGTAGTVANAGGITPAPYLGQP
jgi:hypothetical protein